MAAAEKKQKLMWEALREAVDEEMEADPTVCLMGAAPARQSCFRSIRAHPMLFTPGSRASTYCCWVRHSEQCLWLCSDTAKSQVETDPAW